MKILDSGGLQPPPAPGQHTRPGLRFWRPTHTHAESKGDIFGPPLFGSFLFTFDAFATSRRARARAAVFSSLLPWRQWWTWALMPLGARPAPGELAIREVGRKDDDALWAMLEPVFRAGEAFCVPQDVSRADGLAFWHHGASEDGSSSLRRVFLAELAISTGGFSPVGTFFFAPYRRGNGAHVATAGFLTAEQFQRRGICRRMLGHALQTALGEQYRAMHLDFVVSTGTRAVTLLKHAGFVESGKCPGAFEHPKQGYTDVLALHKTLDEVDLVKWLRETRELKIRAASPEKGNGETLFTTAVVPPAALSLEDDEDEYIEIVPTPQNKPPAARDGGERRPASPLPLAKTLAAESPPKDGDAQQPPPDQEPPLPRSPPPKPDYDESGYDQNDAMHFFHSLAFKIDQYFSEPTVTDRSSNGNGTKPHVAEQVAAPPPPPPAPPPQSSSAPAGGSKKKPATGRKR